MLKELIPYSLKVRLRQSQRKLNDRKKAYRFASKASKCPQPELPYQSSLIQDLKPNAAKKHNLCLAAERIENIFIYPGEVFSFWQVIGNPSAQNGFLARRSLRNGELEDSVGGGLCQLSGLIYFLSLKANLEILERYNHSVDIYTEDTRFTPLGSDATVVYAYKDLRIRNNLAGPIRYSFNILEETIEISLYSELPINEEEIEFQIKDPNEAIKEVITFRNKQSIAKSLYKTQ